MQRKTRRRHGVQTPEQVVAFADIHCRGHAKADTHRGAMMPRPWPANLRGCNVQRPAPNIWADLDTER